MTIDTTIPSTPRPRNTSNIRILVRSCYDLQALRLQMGGRITANFKAKLGQDPGETEDELGEEEQSVLDDLRADYRKLTDGLKKIPTQAAFKGTPLITTYTELCLIDQFIEMEANEKKQFRRLDQILREYPIYVEYLDTIKGIGPAMAAVILSEFDIHKARHPTAFWVYSGYDNGPDGKGRSRRAEHLVKRAYVDKDGNPAEKNSITYNPWLKTKLFVLATSLLRAGNEKYRKIYDDYKFRLENREGWKDESKGHRHNASIRYMIKMFLIDLHMKWRAIEGLPVSLPYHEAKLGVKHHG